MVNNDDTGWKTQAFRQSVINKMLVFITFLIYIHILIKFKIIIFYYSEEAIQRSGMPSNKSSIDMENQVFTKANTKV